MSHVCSIDFLGFFLADVSREIIKLSAEVTLTGGVIFTGLY